MELTNFNPSALLDRADETEFTSLSQFNEGEVGAFWTNPGPKSPWEMHPDCDELLLVLEGKIEVEVLPPESGEGVSKILETGDPQGLLAPPANARKNQRALSYARPYFAFGR